MRRRDCRRHRQHGVALLDVLIALLVIGLGVSALSRLQALALLEGGHARARATAALLAREKLDDLRQFSQLAAGGNGVYGYDEIGNDRGGREQADGSLLLPAGAVTLSDVDYRRSWSALPQSWCAVDAAPVAGVCSEARRAGLQQIRVTLSWLDADGVARTLTLESAIAAMDPQLAGSALIRRPTLLPPLLVPK